MATEMITLKLETVFLKELDSLVKSRGYQNRTEFIRNAVREKMVQTKKQAFMESLIHLKGSSKKKITDEEYHRVREQVFEELEKKLT